MLRIGNNITVGKPIYKFHNNHSVDFDGADDFIQLGEPISYTQHTISTWIKITNETSARVIFDARDSNQDGVLLFVTDTELITHRMGDGTSVDLTTSTPLTSNEWHHVVATYDGDTRKIYTNGTLAASDSISKTIETTTKARIGIASYTEVAPFKGKIDELAIWDRALTAAEVTEIYRIKYGANLIQNGRFDELGSDVYDNDITDATNGGTFTDNGDGTFTVTGIGSPSTAAGVRDIVASYTTTDKFYKWSVTGDNVTLAVYDNSFALVASGTSPLYFKAPSTTRLYISPSDGSSATYSNVSVKQVDPNNRWNNIDDKFSFVNNGGKLTGTDSGQARLYSIPAPTSAGKTYKVSYTVVENNGTSLQHYDGDSYETITSTVGDHSFIYTRQGSNNNFIFRNPSGASAFIVLTNIMLQEQKYVASNLKLNSGNYKSADPVIVSTKSVDFDGSDAYLDAGNVGAVKTLSFWFNPDSDITDSSYSARMFGFNENYYGIHLGASTGMLTGEVLTVLPNGNSRTATTHTFEAGRWYHVAVVWNNTNEYYDIFINGVARTDLNTGTGVNSPFESFLIGTANDTSNFFNGQIDDVGIFNVSLGSDQVIEIYNQGVPSNLATSSAGLNGNLTGYWKMGDGTLDEAPLIADQTNATLGSDVDLTTGSTTAPASWQVISSNKINYLGNDAGVVFYDTGFTATAGKTYKITLTVSNYTGSGSLGWSSTGGVPNPTMRLTSNGTVSSAFVATGNLELRLFGRNTNTGTLTVSVNEVGGNPALMQNTPTIVTDAPLTKIRNYYRMGDGILDTHPLICDMIEPSLGNNLVLNGTFETAVTTDEWTNFNTPTTSERSTTYAYEGNFSYHIVSDAGNEGIFATASQFNGDYAVGDIVKVQAFVYPITASSNQLKSGLNNSDRAFNTTVTGLTLNQWNQIEYYVTIVTATNNYLTFLSEGAGDEFYLDNVSTQVVNGVAGIMTNMSEADITNDVPS